MGLLGRIRKYIKQNTALLLYKTLLLPVIDYGDIIYGTATLNHLGKVQKIQNTACRIILMVNKRRHLLDMHLELKLHRLDMRRKYHLDTLVFKCLSGLSPQYLASLLVSLDQVRNVVTRAAEQGTPQSHQNR